MQLVQACLGREIVFLLHPAPLPTLSSVLLTDCSIILTVANWRKSKFGRRTPGVHRLKRMLGFEWKNGKNKETQRGWYRKQGIWTVIHKTAWSACCCWGCRCIRLIFKVSHPCLCSLRIQGRGCSCHYKRMLPSCPQLWETGLDPARTFPGVYSLPLRVIRCPCGVLRSHKGQIYIVGFQLLGNGR